MKQTPEGLVKKEVDRILKKYHVWYFKPVSSGRGKHGIPDYICCLKGRFVALECKGYDDAKPTTLQQRRLEEIQAAGGTTLVVTPAVLPGLEDWVRRLNADRD